MRFYKAFYAILAISLVIATAFIHKQYTLKKEITPPKITIDKSVLPIFKLDENMDLYNKYSKNEVVKVYATVYKGYDKNSGKVFNFDELNKLTLNSPEDPSLKTNISIESPYENKTYSFGDGLVPNAELTLRGQSARTISAKSYKIKLYDDVGDFRGQTVLNLNKHYFDKTKVKQKFCFDYISTFPDMLSLRTTFVQLFVKDASKGEKEFSDYGLFTHTEQPNRDFLTSRGLDPNGSLYKPSDFEFFKYSDIILQENDPKYNYDAFSKIITAREGQNNQKLIKMLEDVNNYNLDFKKVFNKYFDLDNYLTWLAMNILIDNYDTTSRNYMLYSSVNSDKWYFLPWDYDKCLIEEDKMKENYGFSGIQRYWGTMIHKRFFSYSENVGLLDKKIEELYNIMSTEQTENLTSQYISVIKNFTGSDAVRMYDNTRSFSETVNMINGFDEIIKYNYNRYFKDKEKPMPIFLGEPKKNAEGGYDFSWDASYDLQGDSLSYSLQISDKYDFSKLLINKANIFGTSTSVAKIDKGEYYWRVLITDKKGNTQIPFDYTKVILPEGKIYNFGSKLLVVE